MDHLTICLCQRQQAAHISYARGKVSLVPLPDHQFRWATFFSHPADKGREVMLEYNERAAISRIIIPAIIEHWSVNRLKLYDAWQTALEEFKSGSAAALDAPAGALRELPEEISLTEIEHDYPVAFSQCSLAFPVLVQERREHQMRVRDRALHHLGEVQRVAAATVVLRDISRATEEGTRETISAGMRTIGELLEESHESLCGLYGVCTRAGAVEWAQRQRAALARVIDALEVNEDQAVEGDDREAPDRHQAADPRGDAAQSEGRDGRHAVGLGGQHRGRRHPPRQTEGGRSRQGRARSARRFAESENQERGCRHRLHQRWQSPNRRRGDA